jgi:hypothetical protein
MSIRRHTITIVGGATIATVLAGAAAVAAVDTPSGPATMSGRFAHMAVLDGAAVAEMHATMHSGASVGEMYRWMTEHGVDVEQMHSDMTRAGMNPGGMHRSMAAGR